MGEVLEEYTPLTEYVFTIQGIISRQEAVSMIPPLMLDIKSHHKVNNCAIRKINITSNYVKFQIYNKLASAVWVMS